MVRLDVAWNMLFSLVKSLRVCATPNIHRGCCTTELVSNRAYRFKRYLWRCRRFLFQSNCYCCCCCITRTEGEWKKYRTVARCAFAAHSFFILHRFYHFTQNIEFIMHRQESIASSELKADLFFCCLSLTRSLVWHLSVWLSCMLSAIEFKFLFWFWTQNIAEMSRRTLWRTCK